VPGVGCTADTSCEPSVATGAAEAADDVPPSVGATTGVVDAGAADAATVDAGEVATGAACGFELLLPLSDIIVFTAYAIASASTQPSPITIFFCFAAFSFAASAGFRRAIFFSFRAD
jgi:hypothetical protein